MKVFHYGICLVFLIFVHLSNHGLSAASFTTAGRFPKLQGSISSPPGRLSSGSNNLKYFSTSSISPEWKNTKNKKIPHRWSIKPGNILDFRGNDQFLIEQLRRVSHLKGHNMDSSTSNEEGNSLNQLLEVVGPHLFLIPFALQTLPFAIPALPLSYLLSRYEPAEIGEALRKMFGQLNEMSTMKPHSHTDDAQVIHEKR